MSQSFDFTKEIITIRTEIDRLEQKIVFIEAQIHQQERTVEAWRGYSQRRMSEYAQALNTNTLRDKHQIKIVKQQQEVIERLSRSEMAIAKQATEHRKFNKSNIVVYGSLIMIAILVLHGKLESGDIASVLVVVLPGIIGVSTAVAKN